MRTDGRQQAGGTTGALLPLALIPGVLCALLLFAFAARPLPWSLAWSWIPALGIDLVLHVDGLAAQFLLLICGVGTLVFIYGAGYLADHPQRWRIFLLLLLFMGAMIGAVVSDHLLVLFLFWELTSILSFLLVGSDHAKEASRTSAQQALMVTGAGGLFLLAGFVLLGQIAGTFGIQALLARAPHFLEAPELPAALLLIGLGACTKSAQFPFHYWLPNAMAAPTPVSAYLHSATMVKLGIYLLARLDAAFGELLLWEYSLIAVGTLTALIAAVQTVRERDLKRMLAWSTVATLGTLTMLVGLPGTGAALAVAALLFAHALYKAPLFFVAGNLDHGAGTRKIDKLTGLRHDMPWTAAAALLAALSMAGLPLTFGFVAKDAINFAKEQAGTLQLVSYATVLVNGVAIAVAAIAAIHLFWGRRSPARRGSHPHEAPPAMLLPPLVLAVLGLLFGFVPTLVDPLLGAAARSMAPAFDEQLVEASYDVLQVAEAMAGALLVGGAILLGWSRLAVLLGRTRHLDRVGPESWYWRVHLGLPWLAARQTRGLQHGLLPRYLLTLVGGATLGLLALLLAEGPAWSWPAAGALNVPVLGAALLIAAAAIATLAVRDHLVLLLVGGLVGYGSAVLFLFSGAPDLALTQFAVETVFVVVAAAVLLRLRRSPPQAPPPAEARLRPLPLAVAAGFGATLAALVLLVAAQPFEPALGAFYGEQSLLAAQGRNVVNVILVDFRALDTLGEIAVLFFALLAALPLLRQDRGGPS